MSLKEAPNYGKILNLYVFLHCLENLVVVKSISVIQKLNILRKYIIALENLMSSS